MCAEMLEHHCAQWLCQNHESRSCAVRRTRNPKEEDTAGRETPKRVGRAAVRIGYETSVSQFCVIMLLAVLICSNLSIYINL